jgi:hypothetical protein
MSGWLTWLHPEIQFCVSSQSTNRPNFDPEKGHAQACNVWSGLFTRSQAFPQKIMRYTLKGLSRENVLPHAISSLFSSGPKRADKEAAPLS